MSRRRKLKLALQICNNSTSFFYEYPFWHNIYSVHSKSHVSSLCHQLHLQWVKKIVLMNNSLEMNGATQLLLLPWSKSLLLCQILEDLKEKISTKQKNNKKKIRKKKIITHIHILIGQFIPASIISTKYFIAQPEIFTVNNCKTSHTSFTWKTL